VLRVASAVGFDADRRVTRDLKIAIVANDSSFRVALVEDLFESRFDAFEESGERTVLAPMRERQ
jgi:hypothetical protein